MLMKKKQILTATLVVALGAAVAVNWYYTENPIDTSDKTETTQQVSGNLGDSISVGSSSVSQQEQEETQAVMSNNSFFTTERLKRDEAYDEIIDSIEEIAEKENISDELESELKDMLEKYSRNMKTQADVESLISAKTSGNCLVVINDESDKISGVKKLFEENQIQIEKLSMKRLEDSTIKLKCDVIVSQDFNSLIFLDLVDKNDYIKEVSMI